MKTCPTCPNDLVCHDQGECLRPTPEVDANQRIVLGGVGGDWKVVLADFARRLERERNEARENLKQAEESRVVNGRLYERALTERNEACAEAARLQMELDASCNAEELRQVREENARLREILQRALAAGWDGPLPDYIREQAAQFLTP